MRGKRVNETSLVAPSFRKSFLSVYCLVLTIQSKLHRFARLRAALRFKCFSTVNVALFCLAVSCLPACSKSADNQQQSTNERSKQHYQEMGDSIKFTLFKYIDNDGIGIEAFSFLKPSEWHVEGGVKWVPDNPGMPAVAALKVSNTRGNEEFEVFPSQSFFYTNNRMLLSTLPKDEKYFGNEVRPPVGALASLKGIILPRFRANVKNLTIVREERLADLARAMSAGLQISPGATGSVDAARIRIEYQREGTWIEEEIYGIVELENSSVPSVYGRFKNTNWVVEHLFSFKAEKGGLEGQARIFQTIAHSFRLNPQWFNKYNQVVDYLIQMQIKRINGTGEIGRIISRTHNDISERVMQSYKQRQAVYERIANNFSGETRGVERYHDPLEQKSLELPAGYKNAWTNGHGEYLLSDSSNFTPDGGTGAVWQKMERR